VIPPADLAKYRLPGQKVKKEEIRELCELVRKRYALDVRLWHFKNARECDRPVIQADIIKADAALAKIRRILGSWDKRELFVTEAEWEVFQEIKGRMELLNKRNWANDPPWSGR